MLMKMMENDENVICLLSHFISLHFNSLQLTFAKMAKKAKKQQKNNMEEISNF